MRKRQEEKTTETLATGVRSHRENLKKDSVFSVFKSFSSPPISYTSYPRPRTSFTQNGKYSKLASATPIATIERKYHGHGPR